MINITNNEKFMDEVRDKVQMKLILMPLSETLKKVESGGITEAKSFLGFIAKSLTSPDQEEDIYQPPTLICDQVPKDLNTLDLISHLNSLDHEQTRQIPAFICDYLSQALSKMINGIPSEEAFGFKKKSGGRPRTLPYKDEMLVANFVFDLHEIDGYPIMDACLMTAEYLEECANEHKVFLENNSNDFYRPYENIINILINKKLRKALPEQIRRYYDRHKKALRKIWEESINIKCLKNKLNPSKIIF